METARDFIKALIHDPAVRLAGMVGLGLGGVLVAVAVLVFEPTTSEKAPQLVAERPAPAVRQQADAPVVSAAPPAPVPHPGPTYVPPAPSGTGQAEYPMLPVRPEEKKSRLSPSGTEMAAQGETAAERETMTRPIGPPRIAIVIDDMGVSKHRSARAMRLPGKVTLSFLPYAPNLRAQAAAAAKTGHDIMMHVAMEPESAEIDPGPNVLLTGLPPKELKAALDWNLSQFSGFSGINNHMGSRFTRDPTGMAVVMEVLKARGLYFLDSMTTRDSVGAGMAAAAGVPYARRDIFIDHRDDDAFIAKQLKSLEEKARRDGIAIAIGHPRDRTLRALEAWLPRVQKEGVVLIGVSQAVSAPAGYTADRRGQGTSG